MIKIVKEQIVKTHRYDQDNNDRVLVEYTEQYHYDTENEKIEHKKEMENNGFSDSGQVRDNIGTVEKPIYVWFGSYYKWRTE